MSWETAGKRPRLTRSGGATLKKLEYTAAKDALAEVSVSVSLNMLKGKEGIY